MTIREKLAFYLESNESAIARSINWTITGLVLVSSGIFVVETYPIPPQLRLTLDTLNTLILIGFAIEYLLRFWAAESKINYITNIYSIIDLLVILPFFIGIFDISYIRLFRWFRILRLLRFVESQIFFGGSGSEDNQDNLIIVRILFTLFTIIFLYAGLIYQVEHRVNPQDFQTFLDAVYFAVVTMTTVGFGDVTPLSQGGRLLTVLMILTGIALIPGQVGILIKELVKNADRVETHCPGCGLQRHDRDARFCKICGTPLTSASLSDRDKLSNL